MEIVGNNQKTRPGPAFLLAPVPALLASLAGVGGVLLLLASPVFHWFGVPGARTVDGAVTVVTLEPRVTALYKLMCLGGVAAIGIMRWQRVGRRRQARMATLLFVALLFFPYLVMTWTPAIAAQASWLNAQHENLSWLGGDIFNEQEYKDIAWKRQLQVVDSERQVGVFRLPNWSPYAIQGGRVADLMEWLGYSNRYCQFVCKGWFAALTGTLFLLASLCRGRAGLRYRIMREVGFTGLGTLTVGIVLALTPPISSGFLMMWARQAAQRGECVTALRWLERSATVLPAIREDTYFVAQKGLLEAALGRDTPEARLTRAQRLDRQGFDTQARERYERLISGLPDDSPIRREAVRAVMSMGINELNSGSATTAVDTLLHVLECEPCNLKALYVIQLAGLRTGRFDLVRGGAARMIEIYGRFDTLTKAPVLAACNENLAAVAYQEGQIDEALALHNTAIGRPQP